MDKEHIIQMARDAGFIPNDMAEREWVERFATAIIAATKEEDAKICEQSDADGEGPDCWDWHSKDYAKAIRESKP